MERYCINLSNDKHIQMCEDVHIFIAWLLNFGVLDTVFSVNNREIDLLSIYLGFSKSISAVNWMGIGVHAKKNLSISQRYDTVNMLNTCRQVWYIRDMEKILE